jgi:hypothetical protein
MLKALCNIVCIIIFRIVIIQCHAQSSAKITLAESKLIDSIGFDKTIITKVKSLTNSKAERFYNPGKIKFVKGKEIETGKVYYKGLLFRVNKEKVDQVVASLLNEFEKKGYLIFKSEGNLRNDPYRIGVFKSHDQFEIMKIMGTNASNYGHDNAWVITYLKSIFNRYPFRITGADIDWVKAEFIKPPDNLIELSKELYKNCPDIFENDEESILDVAEKMKSTNKLYLLWE